MADSSGTDEGQPEHRVPLSARALAVLGGAKAWADGAELVFPSTTHGPLDRAALSRMVRQSGVAAGPPGFRSSFRDWAAECADAPREVCELALAHVNTNATEAAYRRTDLFERRRVLMEQWAAFPAASGRGATDGDERHRSRQWLAGRRDRSPALPILRPGRVLAGG